MHLNKLNQNTIIKLEKAGIEKSEAKIEAEILLNHVFEITKKDLILNPDRELPSDKIEIFNKLVDRRIKEKIPVLYLTNKAFFMGKEFYVDENVLIPRPETEILVERVIEYLHVIAKNDDLIKIIDIGTGSGCIAIMLALSLPNAEIYASDISEKAIEIARFNAKKLGVVDKINFIHSDIFKNIDNKEKFDIIVSNPPYISVDEKPELQREVALHEPHTALFTEDKNGVSFYEKLILQAKKRLNAGGFIAVEIGFSQAQEISEIFITAGFNEVKVVKDYNNFDRIVIASFSRT